MHGITEIFLYIFGTIAIIALAIGVSIGIMGGLAWLVNLGLSPEFSWTVVIGIWVFLFLLNII